MMNGLTGRRLGAIFITVIGLGFSGCVTWHRAPSYSETPHFVASRLLEDLRWALETKNTAWFDSLVAEEYVPDQVDLLDAFQDRLAAEFSVNIWCRIDRLLAVGDNCYEVQVSWHKVSVVPGQADLQRERGTGYLVLEIRNGRARLVQKRGQLFF